MKTKTIHHSAPEKVMSCKEAIGRFVKDGDHLVIGNDTVGTCAELVYEVVRQNRKGLWNT